MTEVSRHSEVWKWLAAFLAGVVMAGMPAAFVAFSAPDRADYDGLSRELGLAQVQLARIEERIVAADESATEARLRLAEQIAELRSALGSRPRG